MKFKTLSFFVMTCLFIGSFITPVSARALAVSPQKVTFLNNKGLMLEGWLYKPAGNGPYPAVVLMHGCRGLYSYTDPALGLSYVHRQWGNRLVNAGYVALFVDSFTPRGLPQYRCGTPSTFAVTVRAYDAYAGLNYLASQAFVDANKVGLLGWSQGGSATLAAMDAGNYRQFPNFKVAVTFYPGCGLTGFYDGIKNSTWNPYAPFIILHGSADTIASPAHCQTRIRRARELGATNVSITIYPNAQHGFDGARKTDPRWTQFDIDAKISADAKTMEFFTKWLQ